MTERFAFYGLASNLMTFLTNELGQSTATAAKHINTWLGVSYLFPILGAFLADSILGRFKTVLLSSFVYLLVRTYTSLFSSSQTNMNGYVDER